MEDKETNWAHKFIGEAGWATKENQSDLIEDLKKDGIALTSRDQTMFKIFKHLEGEMEAVEKEYFNILKNYSTSSQSTNSLEARDCIARWVASYNLLKWIKDVSL